jgi:hypothetical protein
MRQAIVTHRLAPTNHRGTRVKATCEAGTVTIAWDHALNLQENHRAAARALLFKLKWRDSRHYGGGLPYGGYVFVDDSAALT